MKICEICDNFMVREKCGARKMVEYNDKTRVATVYHLGIHICHTRIDNKRKRGDLKEKVNENKTTHSQTANQVRKEHVGYLLSQGRFEEAKEEARIWLDHKMAKKVIDMQNPTFSLDENSFDAVEILKAETDKHDPFYIYRINNGRLNGGTDYVFKSSGEMALLAIKMNVNNEEETGLIFRYDPLSSIWI